MIAAVLAEDVGAGDLTTDAIVPATQTAVADIVLREAGVICGLAEATAVFHELDPDLRVDAAAADGAVVDEVPFAVARLTGSARAILTGERTARPIPGGVLKVCEDAPHGLFITHRKRLDGDLLAFIGT